MDLILVMICWLKYSKDFLSNRWCNLISDVRHSFKEPWALVYLHPPICHADRKIRKLKFLTSSICENPFLRTGLPFLPKVLEKPGVTIEASFNDLILFKAATSYSNTYYICNPFTKQYMVLPPPSVTSHFHKHCCLISEPLPSTKQKKYNEISSEEFRFRVVIATCVDLLNVHNKNLLMEIYSSETGSCTKHNVPRSHGPCCGSVKKLVAGCGQILMWVHPACHGSSSVIFNPFNAPSFNLIEAPSVGLPSNCIQKTAMDVFTSQDCILLCQTPLIKSKSDPALSVWELNVGFKNNDSNLNEPSWKLIHRVSICEMEHTDEKNLLKISSTADFLKRARNLLWPYYPPNFQITCVVGFNPLDANLIFLMLTKDRDSSCLVIYDMRTKAIDPFPEEQMPDIDSRSKLLQALLMKNPRPLLFPFVALSNPTLF